MSKIFLDPGHGGTETGAIGHGMIEKNINLVVAMEIKRILELNKQTVKMSRESDITIGLSERCDLANQWAAEYFVSIHHNANDGQSSGTEIYASISSGKGLDLANSLARVFQYYGRHTATIQRRGEVDPAHDYYAVIRNTNMPSIITEAGYIDSDDYINFDTVQELLNEANRIAEGVLSYLGITNIIYKSNQKQEHWAQGAFDYLRSREIKINETRFDDKITRGEAFALLAQLVK